MDKTGSLGNGEFGLKVGTDDESANGLFDWFAICGDEVRLAVGDKEGATGFLVGFDMGDILGGLTFEAEEVDKIGLLVGLGTAGANEGDASFF